MTTHTLKPLQADVYDTLELMALANKGIGFGPWFENHDPNCPNCAHGLLLAADGCSDHYDGRREGSSYLSLALLNAGVGGLDSDAAVRRILVRRGVLESEWAGHSVAQHLRRAPAYRVTFEEWCAETGIIRAAA